MYILCMSLFSAAERHFLTSVANLGYCNPFLPERMPLEKGALGEEFVSSGPVWSVSVAEPDLPRPNVVAIHKKVGRIVEDLQARLANPPELDVDEMAIYE